MAVKKAPKSNNKAVHARLIDYRRAFGTESGKRVLRDLIDSHYLLRPTYAKDLGVNEMLLREGERNAILKILTILKTDPNEFLKRIEEIEQDARSNDE